MTPSERCVRRQPSAATSGCSPRAAARVASTCSSPRGSGGRAWLGIGAGYHGEEAQALDLPLPPVGERFERLEETLQIAIRMWAGNETPFEGMHYRLWRPVDSPGPAQRSHPPILIGGAGVAVHQAPASPPSWPSTSPRSPRTAPRQGCSVC
jgi:alkanesulfonate monooxygenase SsuD/methylene tetrahydromethanopterin reductase-like flavin-dependent oxidoreductase (luciferase family)